VLVRLVPLWTDRPLLVPITVGDNEPCFRRRMEDADGSSEQDGNERIPAVASNVKTSGGVATAPIAADLVY
jgi:hypothetical protein